MKKLSAICALIFSAAAVSTISAQSVAPPGSGDKNLGDNNVKTRSIELERVDREAHKPTDSPANANTAATAAEDRLAVKYGEIKTDYEQMQMSLDATIKAYGSGSDADFAQIGKSALEINGNALRLNANLFPVAPPVATVGEKTVPKVEKAVKPAKSIREVIVELDNSIGAFTTSPMFQNLRVVDAEVSGKAKTELEKIIELSATLNAEAQKKAVGK